MNYSTDKNGGINCVDIW